MYFVTKKFAAILVCHRRVSNATCATSTVTDFRDMRICDKKIGSVHIAFVGSGAFMIAYQVYLPEESIEIKFRKHYFIFNKIDFIQEKNE